MHSIQHAVLRSLFALLCFLPGLLPGLLIEVAHARPTDGVHGAAAGAAKPVRVFIFAGQSNMVGSDSAAADIERFPPFAGLDEPQKGVRFHYCIGRESKTQSDGWEDLAPIRGVVGPELSFARRLTADGGGPVAIIKVAAGGTTLGGDWNPDEPSGFELYPLALQRVKEALAALDRRNVDYTLEGFMWHQGENDMFNGEFRAAYGVNLARFLACWRRDLEQPELPFYIGELCCKTVWGMDNRNNMHAIEQGQRAVTDADPYATYVPTNHVGVKIGGGAGLHYHYGTLGQLQHGEAHAEAYLRRAGTEDAPERALKRWPYRKGETVSLFVLAGHRNMEGERGFSEHLSSLRGKKKLARPDPSVPYRYSVGGGHRSSVDWEPMGPAGFNGTFGPEVSMAARLKRTQQSPIAIVKYTHSGSQMVDWTPAGSAAPTRNEYPDFLRFVRDAIADLEARGHPVKLAGIFYHVGENDMAWGPFRRQAPEHLAALVSATREDLERPKLRWWVSQQAPPMHESLAKIDAVAAIAAVAAEDPNMTHLPCLDLPGREEGLVLTAAGLVELGERLAESFAKGER